MRIGTPGFAGARLREAREARGLTAVSLAELSGVTPQAISQYEHDAASPNPQALATIAQVLKVPLPFFTASTRAEQDNTVFYRSMSVVTKRARKRACWQLEWLKDVSAYLEKLVVFPPPNLPDLRLPADPLRISDDDIENAAEDARRYWGMSQSAPIGNMVSLLENQGVIIARQELEADTLDSLSVLDPSDGRPYIVVGVDKGTAVRWRFDAAHELGHLLLHSQVPQRELGRTADFKKIEAQAHRFAAAFLLPLEPFSEDLFATSLDVMRAMKPKWKVSIALMIMRARQAKLLTEETEKRLWINLSRRGWRRAEPYDDEIPAEEPSLMRRATAMILTSGGQTIEDISASVRLTPSDIERLVGLPSTADFAPHIQWRRHQEPASSDSTSRPPADVIALPLRRKETGHNV